MPARADGLAIGVNVVDPYKLTVAEQDAMLGRIAAAGIHTIRASLTFDDHGIAFAERATAAGLNIDWLIFRFGGYSPGGPALSSADPETFRRTFAPILAKLEADGITLAAFELGNEFNLGGYNADLPRAPQGMVYGASDLASPKLQSVARGYLQYLKVLATLKDIRDRSKLNAHTPVLSGGLAVYESADGALPSGTSAHVVSVAATLGFLRAHGLDALVDAYAIHVYPRGNAPGDPVAADDRKTKLAAYALGACRRSGSATGKPCWLTEWGFNDADAHCPIDDSARSELTREMMGDFRPYVRDGRLVGLLAYAWNDVPGTTPVSPLTPFRCGALSAGGKLSVDANLLK
ncbi:MAG: hypothetical protein IAI48_11420 [Candidatus Eremiobacteraeota bacterium]|nr:hypothetical protein [Candidatus Eremiobacteraeota bacterium]